jgi:hypothetical protein
MNNNQSIRPIYNLHIPRTSGTNTLFALQREIARMPEANKNKLNKHKEPEYADLNMYTPDVLEFIYDHDKMKNYNYISGHFATNPIHEIDNLLTFSIVRNPVDQFVSTIAYRCMTARVPFTSHELDLYIDGMYKIWGEFEGFSGIDNPQSHFLSQKLAAFELEKSNRGNGSLKGMAFVGSPQSLADVRQFTDDMIISTLENRHIAIDKINVVLQKQFGITIENDTRKVNSTMKLRFEISKDQMKKMKAKLELDEEVYQHVKQQEKNVPSRINKAKKEPQQKVQLAPQKESIAQMFGTDSSMIRVIDNFIPSNDIEKIVEMASKITEWRHEEPGTEWHVRLSDADSLVKLNSDTYGILETYARAAKNCAEELFNCTLKFRKPALVRCIAGMHQPELHTNKQNLDGYLKEGIGDGDLSAVMYLNDDFEGGELVFPQHDVRVTPTAGRIVIYPGDNAYLHYVDQVTAGVRWACPLFFSVDEEAYQHTKEQEKKDV